MCLFTSPFALVQPTERGKALGKLLLYLMAILFVIMILSFFVDSTLGIFGLMTVITGWCAVRDSNRYNIEQTMCVVLFSGYLFVICLVDCILYLVTYDTVHAVKLIALFGGLLFYFATVVVSKKLYDELRLNYQPPPPEEMNGPPGMPGMFGGGLFGGGGGGMFGRPPPPNRDVNQGGQGGGQIPARQQNRKFQAFSGEGHTLG